VGVKKEALLLKLAALMLRKRVEVLVTNDKGHVLVGVNPRHGSAQLPGGGVDGDTVNHAAKKEALEEVGVELSKVRGFGAKPVVRKLNITKKDDTGKVTTWDGHRTYWRTGTYTGSSDRALGADGDAMRDVKFLPINDAITRLQARKPDGSKDILASARVAALRKLQAMLAGGTKK
jgi:8-oxo-dGTP pyrophosphatase MutT (NUDIX family)